MPRVLYGARVSRLVGLGVVLIAVTFSRAVIAEASLSFLGLGVQPSTVSGAAT